MRKTGVLTINDLTIEKILLFQIRFEGLNTDSKALLEKKRHRTQSLSISLDLNILKICNFS